MHLRLDRFISENTLFSRTEVKRLIAEQRVLVNKEVATAAKQKIHREYDLIRLDGVEIFERGHLYLMLHKPAGYVSATRDSEHPVVLDLLDNEQSFLGDRDQLEHIKSAELQIVGRLDKDTSGLLFLTTDGAWNHKMCAPNQHLKKTYLAELAEKIDSNAINLFKTGILLRSESRPTKPAELEILSDKQVKISIEEGRYHQVKRMFAALGNRVTRLRRLSIGGVALDDNLASGEYRSLTLDERAKLES